MAALPPLASAQCEFSPSTFVALRPRIEHPTSQLRLVSGLRPVGRSMIKLPTSQLLVRLRPQPSQEIQDRTTNIPVVGSLLAAAQFGDPGSNNQYPSCWFALGCNPVCHHSPHISHLESYDRATNIPAVGYAFASNQSPHLTTMPPPRAHRDNEPTREFYPWDPSSTVPKLVNLQPRDPPAT